MRESVTYMAIIDEGREIQARKMIQKLGTRKLGPPDEATITLLEGITDIDRLEQILERVFDATSWQDLLDTP